MSAFRNIPAAWVVVLGVLLCASEAPASKQRDGAAGFRVNLPPGWHAVSRGAGHVVLTSPNPLEYADVRPVLQRTSDCATTLHQVLTSGGGVGDLQIAQTGPGVAVARFFVRNGAGRGAVMCAETSRNVGMLYGAVVPANAFAREWPNVMAVLRSFAYQPRTATGSHPGGGAEGAPPPLTTWREPNEHAFVMSVPAGWQVHGGIHRLDATHYTSGVEARSPDSGSGVRIGDSRIGQCTVPGPGMNNMPPANGTMRFCPVSTAEQVGALYLRSLLARDLGLSDVQIAATPRADLARRAEAIPASFGLRVHCSVEELRFRALRRGSPVSGAVVIRTTLFDAAQGQNFIVGTLSSDVQSFWGPAERFGALARLTGAMQASMRIDPVWWEQTQRINAEITRRTLAQMRSEAANAQQASWDRMAAADRRSESVGYLLSGTSRLSDAQGHTYEAKAGSNYYFLGANGTVAGTDIWPSGSVNLQQLEVIR